jgi:excisionase family DNA binding protein
MSPREVAESFGVDPKTVTRWANDGRLATVRTPGGHRRYDAEQVREIAARGG